MKINNTDKLTQPEVAGLLLKDAKTIRNYAKEDPPIPSWGKGRDLYYVWDEVVEWWFRRKFKSLYSAATSKDPDGDDMVNGNHEKALLYREQRIKASIDNAKLLRETLSLEDYQREMAEKITPARQNLLALEAKLRAEIGSEHASVVGREIKKALRSLGGEKEDAAG